MGCLGGTSLRRLSDSNSRFFRAGLPIYYRTANFDATTVGQGVAEMGFTVTAPPVIGFNSGTTDVKICPQPGVTLLTLKELSDAINSGAALREGARRISISHTWVWYIYEANYIAKGWTNPRQVFNDPSVVGFYHDGLLFSIVSFVHNDMYGTPINWDVVCNANEIK
jgi:hypothetical protein